MLLIASERKEENVFTKDSSSFKLNLLIWNKIACVNSCQNVCFFLLSDTLSPEILFANSISPEHLHTPKSSP